MSWGSDAHEVVGLVAQQLLDSNTATFVSNVLSGASLGSVAVRIPILILFKSIDMLFFKTHRLGPIR